MWKYRHTALVIFALALPCFGQFTEIWTNGNLFAVEQMASQCYSAGVERCVAAGVTPDSPSWWDYLIGKNHAKLVSVKANINACIPYCVRSVTNALSILQTTTRPVWDGSLYAEGLSFSNSAHFLTYCGLPTNALDETPYFKTQYPSVTVVWQNVFVMLTNMTDFAEFSLIMAYTNSTLGTWIDGEGIATNENASNIGPDYAFTIGSTNAFKRSSDRYWYPLSFYSYMNPELFEFKGTHYAFSTANDEGDFDAQDDNVDTNFVQYVEWTNSIGGVSPLFCVAPSKTNRPPHYGSTRMGYTFDIDGINNVTIYKFTATTNGFKYK